MALTEYHPSRDFSVAKLHQLFKRRIRKIGYYLRINYKSTTNQVLINYNPQISFFSCLFQLA